MRIIIRYLTAVVLSVSVFNVAADNQPPSDQISFQVEADQEIENDRVSVVMKAYSENADPSKLADQINQAMRWGLDTAKKMTAIKVRTGAYQTYPVYSEKNKVQRWRGQQELILEGREVDKLSELVGTLQSRLQMQSMQFSVSPDARRKVQDVLIEEVLQAYKKRAELVSKSLGAAGYDIMNISIQTSGHIYPPPVRMESMRTVSKASVESPAMEAGTSRVSVQANGTIHLQR